MKLEKVGNSWVVNGVKINDQFVNDCITAEEEHRDRWYKAHMLILGIMGAVQVDRDGNYYVSRAGGMHYLPDALNEALQAAQEYLNTF